MRGAAFVMNKNCKNILITGLPGIGKTTLVKQLSDQTRHLHPVGFYSEEIRQEGRRKGFQLVNLDGRISMLAHVLIKSSYQVGKYKVDIKGFDEFIDSMAYQNWSEKLVIIDEIGKMECMSGRFRKMVFELLDSDNIMIATISHTDGGIKGEIKKREDVTIFHLNLDNRDLMCGEILQIIRENIQPQLL